MKYTLFILEGDLLKPSKKAKEQYAVPASWCFPLSRLLDTVIVEDWTGVSEPISVLAQKVKEEGQLEFLLELISLIKKRDIDQVINWENTNKVIAYCQLFFVFLDSEVAKKIDRKYQTRFYGIPRKLTVLEEVRKLDEQMKAFEQWRMERE